MCRDMKRQHWTLTEKQCKTDQSPTRQLERMQISPLLGESNAECEIGYCESYGDQLVFFFFVTSLYSTNFLGLPYAHLNRVALLALDFVSF